MPLVAEPWLQAGKLTPCSTNALALGETYRLYRPGRRVAPSEAEQRFADWLHQEADISLATFVELTRTDRHSLNQH
jgi:hypothetical protein